MMSFTFKKTILVGNKRIESQEELDRIFINPEDELVKKAIKDGDLGWDRGVFEEKVAAEEKGGKKAEKPSKPGKP